MTNQEIQEQALTRALNGQSLGNYATVIREFMEKGIPCEEIRPRENVFTFQAWKALGRFVRKGEHGVKIITFIPTTRKEEENGEQKERVSTRPWSTTVFHVSQTETAR